MDTKGYIKFARSTIYSDVFVNKPDKWFKIWFYILSQVNHKGFKHLKRGENLFRYSEIMHFTGATHAQVERFIRWGKSDDMLTTRKTTRGMIISVVNYSKYQDNNACSDDTQDDRSDDEETTGGRQGDDKETTLYTRTKERKNVRTKDIAKDKSFAKKKKPKKQKMLENKTPMTLEQFIAWTKKSPSKHIHFIGEWADTIKPACKTLGQWQVFVSENVKYARQIIEFDTDQIAEAYTKALVESEKMGSSVTSKTLIKYLTK